MVNFQFCEQYVLDSVSSMINTVIEALDSSCQSNEIDTLHLAVSMLDQVKIPTESADQPF